MSTPPEVPVSAAAAGPEATTPGAVRCPRCGAEVGPDQDWCLVCGAPARTRLAPTPSWKLPVAALAVVAVLLGAGLAAGFVALTKDPAPEQAQPAAAATTAAAPAASTPAPTASVPTVTVPSATSAVPTATTPGTIVPGIPTTASVPTIGTVPVPTTAQPGAGGAAATVPGG